MLHVIPFFRPSMSQWPMQRNVYTFVPQTNPMTRSHPQEPTHILTTHNANTPRASASLTPANAQVLSSSNLVDDSLTNLSWLHDINIMKRAMPTINAPPSSSVSNKRKEPSSPSSCPLSNGAIYPNDILDSTDLALSSDDDDRWRMYRANPQAKPIYSYSQLILLAMKQSGHEKMTLQMIYEWVAEHFPYFKQMEPTWQNSIRHNLSLNKCFIKVPRTKKEAGLGKGGFWKLSSDYEKQRSLMVHQQHQPSIAGSPNKRARHSKRPAAALPSNSMLSEGLASNMKSSSRISHENIKHEYWIDPILPCFLSKTQSPLHCHTTMLDRPHARLPTSFLSPTSSPDASTVSPFRQQQINEFSAILTPSPSNSPSSTMSKQHFPGTKFDDADMLLLDPSTFDWDAYLCETPNDIDVQPLLSAKTEQDLFNDFNAALTDLTSSAEAAAAAAVGSDPNHFDAFDYSSRHSNFHSLFEDDDDDDQQQPQTMDAPNSSDKLAVKGCGIKRPAWWMTTDYLASTKLPSLESAFDLKLPK